MRKLIAFGGMVCLFTLCLLMAHASEPGGDSPAQDITPLANRILSEDEDQRILAITHLGKQYSEECDAIVLALEDAATNHRSNKEFGSPLNCAINAARSLRVYEAEDTLLSLADYQLAGGRRHVGGVAGGDICFPAAAALVSLRVDVDKVVDAIVQWPEDQSESGIRLLTWVVARRANSLADAKKVLEPRGANGNVAKAIAWLGKVTRIDGLLFGKPE
jgi:hypothetical protein